MYKQRLGHPFEAKKRSGPAGRSVVDFFINLNSFLQSAFICSVIITVVFNVYVCFLLNCTATSFGFFFLFYVYITETRTTRVFFLLSERLDARRASNVAFGEDHRAKRLFVMRVHV